MKRIFILAAIAAVTWIVAPHFTDEGDRPGSSSLYDRQLRMSVALLENPVTTTPGEEAAVIWNPASVSITSGCWASVCIVSGCVISGCAGSACVQSGCVGSACVDSGCIGSGCVVSGCAGSFCMSSGCLGSACKTDDCDNPGDPDPVPIEPDATGAAATGTSWWEGSDRLLTGF